MIHIDNRTDKPLEEDKQRNELISFVNSFDGQLCLQYFDVFKLEGFMEDDEDYYYIVRGKYGLEYISCVADLYPLNLYLPKPIYDDLLTTFNNNYCVEGVYVK